MDQAELHPAELKITPKINATRQIFPYCIVWTPLPFITWFFPPIGHLGICASDGTIHDFGGPYYVSEGRMTFGRVTRYMQLNKRGKVSAAEWDAAVQGANDDYRKLMHNICVQNCHHHAAHALNIVGYDGGNWGQFRLGLDMFLFGTFTSFGGFLKTWLPFLVLICIIMAFSFGA